MKIKTLENGAVEIEGYLSYEMTLEAAGFTVLLSEHFGSYQGDWLAKVRTPEGELLWVHGYFGSCSGCDALEAAFGFGFGEDFRTPGGECGHRYTPDEWARVIEFGKSEGEERYTQAEVEALAVENIEWDVDARRMLAFVKENAL